MPELNRASFRSLLRDVLNDAAAAGSQSARAIGLEISAGSISEKHTELIGPKPIRATKPRFESLSREILRDSDLADQLERSGEVEVDLSERDLAHLELPRVRYFYARELALRVSQKNGPVTLRLHGWIFSAQRSSTPFSPLLLRTKFDQLGGVVRARFTPPSVATFIAAIRRGATEDALMTLKELYSLDAVVLWLYDDSTRRYRSLGSVGTKNHVFKVPARRPGRGKRQGIVSQIKPNRRAVVYDSQDRGLWRPPFSGEWEPFDRDLFKAQSWRSCMALPIVSAGRVVGALSVYSSRSAAELVATEGELADHAANCAEVIYGRREDDVLAALAARYDEELVTANVSISALSLSHDILHYYRSVLQDVKHGRAYLETDQEHLALEKLVDAQETMQRTEPALKAMRKLASEARAPQIETGNRPTPDAEAVLDELKPLLRSILPHFSKPRRLAPEHVRVKTRGDVRPVGVAPLTLERITVNLCVNAAQWKASNIWVTGHFDRSDDEFQLVVRDDGLGIPAAEREQVFDRFFSGRGGSGLGLYVVKSLAMRVGGEVHLQSYHRTDGLDQRGTVVTVVLPTK